MNSLEQIFMQIKSLTDRRFFGKVNLIFENGNLVHSEITQKLKPDTIIIKDKITVLMEST